MKLRVHHAAKALGLLALAAALAGCMPEERIVWAPDGSAAIVLSNDKLFLCTPQGALTRVAEGITAANWLSDSKRLVVAHKVALATWKDAAVVLPAGRRRQIEDLSAPLRRQMLAFQGDWDKFKPDVPAENQGDLSLALLCLRDEKGQGLREKLGAKYDMLGQLRVDTQHLAVCPATADARIGPTLAIGLTCMNPQGSPDGKTISFCGDFLAQSFAEPALIVVPAAGGTAPRVVAQRTALWSGWSPDGRYLAYAAANGPKQGDAPRLGTVSRSRVTADDGQLLPAGEDFPREDLAGILFAEYGKVACLGDGRILFISVQTELPATTRDMPQQLSLFTVDPRQPTTVTRVLPRDTQAKLLGKALMYFSVSPDGKRAAVPGPKGELCVVTLDSGVLAEIVTKPGPQDVVALPTWRSNDELCFVAPIASALCTTGKPEIVLVKLTPQGPGPAQCLSKDWPQTMRENLLDPSQWSPAK
jgi:hypothetical protein